MVLIRPRGVVALTALELMVGLGAPPQGESPTEWFDDQASSWGLTVFQYVDGSRGRRDLVEIMGGGVALADFDDDGRLDVWLANGGPIGPGSPPDDPPSALFLQTRPGRFLPADPPIPGPSYAMGAAVGDFDGDGRRDLLVTGWRGLALLRNLGGGRFEETSDRLEFSQVKNVPKLDELWTTSAAWGDLDGDGDLDLYICAYVHYDPTRAPYCAAPDGRRDYCGPLDFAAQRDLLFRNDGGRLVEVGETLEIDQPPRRGLGVVVADVNDDGQLDLFIANDAEPARLWLNRGHWVFEEVGELAGVAFDAHGQPPAGMGVVWADLIAEPHHQPTRFDLAVANFFGRGTLVYRNLGAATFQEVSESSGLSGATRDVLGFGLVALDVDRDGRLDLVQANGHVLDRDRLGEPFRQPLRWMRSVGPSRFVAQTQAWANPPRLGRGLAVGDVNNDGLPDLVTTRLDGPPALLIARAHNRPGLTIRLRPRPGQADPPIGARVVVHLASDDGSARDHVGVVVGGGSYLSASDDALFVPLPHGQRVASLKVVWPSGETQEFDPMIPSADQERERSFQRIQIDQHQSRYRSPEVRPGLKRGNP
ncbi:ASPIC/UnbV domain protein [Isosphaera pallida ATCC 43644]|uniref:ASPIC/UnbV domain protein n=1 Tax=Isosphaera pallida (strain ATCC 43644 / DSM 9630 / IS1B) TaxID=575540 RepID=E8R328_ISOPI|nr:CRTAC1 family protein [Isosphaera pallida]ADV62547.1 ASPIC/UnbV domain protein [Isosphaera pallida ATCC 43644]